MKKLLTRREVAELLGLKSQTLAKWGMTGKNLSVIKIGPRTVRYLNDDVMSFIALSTANKSGNYNANARQIEES